MILNMCSTIDLLHDCVVHYVWECNLTCWVRLYSPWNMDTFSDVKVNIDLVEDGNDNVVSQGEQEWNYTEMV